ncbi:MAG: pyridoxal-dependent decarboxylase, partial [Rhizobiaceae bacterium]
PDTIMLVGSAPAFPHGVIDPIPELGAIALERDLWLHVDACVGGYSAPFAKMLGVDIPDFDLSVPGVTSMSADLHKYGFTAKGASCILYAKTEDFEHQAYTFTNWQRGTYSTQTFVGTRAGGAIAAAWAVMNYLGIEGYKDVTRRVLATRKAFEEVVRSEGLEVFGVPKLGIVSFGSSKIDMFAVADRMKANGWMVGRLTEPRGLHMMLNLAHESVLDEFKADLSEALSVVKAQNIVSIEASTY